MGLMCWLFGHKKNKIFEKFIMFSKDGDIMVNKTKIGTVTVNGELAICSRCNNVYAEIITKREY